MSTYDLPFLPAALWIIAAGCLILLLIVVFGYHVYQRGRLRALVADAGHVAELAARKESLAAEIEEMREWLATQKNECLKLEAERHQQELVRADMARLERSLAEKREEGQAIMTRMADLDMAFARRRQFQARLEGEIRALEAQREELEPMEKYARELRMEIDQGKMRMAQLAQEEIRAQSLQTQAQMLKREIEELRETLAPLREERERLKQFVDQARHASAVKNEQLLEQKKEMQALERHNEELAKRNSQLLEEAEEARQRHEEFAEALAEMEKTLASRQRAGEDLRQAVFAEQTQLDILMQRREEKEKDLASLNSRKTALELALEEMKEKPAKAKNKPREARGIQNHKVVHGAPRKGPINVRKRPEILWNQK